MKTNMVNKTLRTLYIVPLCMVIMFGLSSCDLNHFPSDELNANVLLDDPSGAEYVIDGCYAMLKDEYEYIEYASSNTYVRHYLQMAEFPADNTTLANRTTDPLFQATCYKMTDNLKNVGLFWWVGYKVIFSANTVIEKFKEGESAEIDQLLGEAYFLRAMCHFHMVSIFGKPYVINNGDNPGIPLRTSTNTDVTTRATVKDVYAQVIADLTKASQLMKKPRHGGNPGYATKNAALGLLSRVYLYMNENQKVLDVISEMGDPTANLDPDYPNYFANALKSKETLFCVAHTTLENRGSASIGSMYNGDGGGWGEVYCSDPLLNLYERYPDDARLSYIKPQYAPANKDEVYFAIPDAETGSSTYMWGETKTDAEGLYTTIDGTKYRITEEKINGKGEIDPAGEYKLNFVSYKGEKYNARLTKTMVKYATILSPNYWVTKYGYQDGLAQLSSPVFLRWAEIVLNRAEAKAKLGDTNGALNDVNAIRARAGIPSEGMFAAGKMHGYDNVLDVVLDERRMELAFEGHRMFDVYRNQRDMDRRFGGVQPWEIVKYTDNKIQFPIPYGETSVSGIPQNPGY